MCEHCNHTHDNNHTCNCEHTHDTNVTSVINPDSNKVPCDHCGQMVNPDELTEVDGELWCEECRDRDATECDRCGNYTADENIYRVGCDDWCNECVTEAATVCGRCDELTDVDETVTVMVGSNGETEEWCEYCAENWAYDCEDCDAHFAMGEREGGYEIEMYDGETRYVCADCYENNYCTCEECGNCVSNDDVVEIDGDYYCPNCAHARRGLRPYGQTYGNNFYRIPNDPTPEDMYLGIELETEADYPEEMAQTLIDAIGEKRIECKKDGSLTDGCEIVSQPMSAAYHLTDSIWPDIVNICRDNEATSHDNGDCGMHIHISSKYLYSRAMVCTLDRLIQTHPVEWLKFSRRPSSGTRWAKIESNSDLGIYPEDTPAQKRDKWAKHKYSYGRYVAVNVSTNTPTIEIRLWRGSLNIETIRATIEATAGLAILAHDLTESGRECEVETMTWDELTNAISVALTKNGLPNTDFWAYIERRELMTLIKD